MTDSGKNASTRNSLSVTDSANNSDHSLLEELKEACLSAVERYVAVRVPHGSILSLLLEFVARHGAEVVEHWGEEDMVDVDFSSDEDEDE